MQLDKVSTRIEKQLFRLVFRLLQGRYLVPRLDLFGCCFGCWFAYCGGNSWCYGSKRQVAFKGIYSSIFTGGATWKKKKKRLLKGRVTLKKNMQRVISQMEKFWKWGNEDSFFLQGKEFAARGTGFIKEDFDIYGRVVLKGSIRKEELRAMREGEWDQYVWINQSLHFKPNKRPVRQYRS